MNQNLIKSLEQSEKKEISFAFFTIFLLAAVLLGGSIGLFVSRRLFSSPLTGKKIETKTKEGMVDKKTFRDQAEGILKEGGIDGEGNFHLERPGGASQNVYLTSSTVDLSKYVGKKVRVYGETFSAEKAGWLMDVGLVEIIQ